MKDFDPGLPSGVWSLSQFKMHQSVARKDVAGGPSITTCLERSPGGGMVKKIKRGTPIKKSRTNALRKMFERNFSTSSPESGSVELLQQHGFTNPTNLATTTGCLSKTGNFCASQPQRETQTRPRGVGGTEVGTSQNWSSQARLSQTDQPQGLGQSQPGVWERGKMHHQSSLEFHST